jgi:glycosyltransferase involved in cell wall biosynthesis
MPLLSVLTPAHVGRAEFLVEAGRSLADQELPVGWRLEWVVQEDGDSPALSAALKDFRLVRYQANEQSLGIAVTRNLALSRARGVLSHMFDSDDLLLPGGLNAVITAFETHPRIQWVAGQADDLLWDSTRIPFPPRMPPGYVEPGALTAYLDRHGEPPVHPAGLTYRTETARALGGWVACPRLEDLALLVAFAELTPGYLTKELTWLYRRHAEQTTGQASWATLHDESMTLIRQRVNALRHARCWGVS